MKKTGFGIEYTLEDTKLYEVNGKIMKNQVKVFYMMKMKKLFLWVFLNNKKNGIGILYQNKNILYKGLWLNDTKHGEGKLYYNNLNTIYYAGLMKIKNTVQVKFTILMVILN